MDNGTINNTPTNSGGNSAKTPRVRSSAYPSYIIRKCYDLTDKVNTEFTDVVYTPQEDIVKNVGTSGGAFLMFLSSCVQYGLLELKKGVGYKPSALFKKIKRPLPNENVTDLLKECLLAPDLYKKIISEFNGKPLPSKTGLANILDRNFNVKGNAADKAALILLKNLEQLNCLRDGNILDIDSSVTVAEEVFEQEEENEIEAVIEAPAQQFVLLNSPKENNTVKNENNTKTRDIPIFLNGGREATLVMPVDFNEDDMRRVSKVVNGYLP